MQKCSFIISRLICHSTAVPLLQSFESFELLAKAISFPMLERILLPLRNLMVEFSSTSFTRDAGEVLRRLVLGLNANQSVDRVDFLIFVFQLMTGEGQLFRVAGGDVEMRDNFERNFTYVW